MCMLRCMCGMYAYVVCANGGFCAPGRKNDAAAVPQRSRLSSAVIPEIPLRFRRDAAAIPPVPADLRFLRKELKKTMKETYVTPEMEITYFETEDIIRTSEEEGE